MDRLPDEFEELLTAKGRRLLRGEGPHAGALNVRGARFISLEGMIDRRRAASVLSLLEKHIFDRMEEMNDPIPPETIWGMERDYEEWLPKSVRVCTAYCEKPEERAWAAAERIGLVRMMRSESFHAFASAVSGRPLRKPWGMQVLCYRPGDYTGPHNDHHPEDPEARDGYFDLHLTLATTGVAHHALVYEQAGHLSGMDDVNTLGGITAYRLPFWHYTTPLQARPGQEDHARRWVLLGTFLYDRQGVPAPPTGRRRTVSIGAAGPKDQPAKGASTRRSPPTTGRTSRTRNPQRGLR